MAPHPHDDDAVPGPARLGVLALVLLLSASLVLVAQTPTTAAATGLPSTSVSASSAASTGVGRVRGEIRQVGRGGSPKVKVLWFARDWTYLGQRSARGGYSLRLRTGRYFLQFVDQAPAYDVRKNRPTTVKVQVRPGGTTVKNVKLRRGASIGGVARTKNGVAKKARIVAANTDEQSFETVADKRGRFALGGLPPGKYSVFTYDRQKRFVAKSLYLGKLKGSKYRAVSIKLNRRAGSLLVDVYAGSNPIRGRPFVTAVSRKNGQFWTARAQRGAVTFRGLYPGAYDLQVPGTGNYFEARVRVRKGRVKPGRTVFGSARVTKRGAWLTGTVVDGTDADHALGNALVRLLDASGTELDRTITADDGSFTLDGQIRTQRGLRVIAGPGPFSDFLDDCLYDSASVDGVRATAGRRTTVGVVSLPRSDSPEQPEQCRTESS